MDEPPLSGAVQLISKAVLGLVLERATVGASGLAGGVMSTTLMVTACPTSLFGFVNLKLAVTE